MLPDFNPSVNSVHRLEKLAERLSEHRLVVYREHVVEFVGPGFQERDKVYRLNTRLAYFLVLELVIRQDIDIFHLRVIADWRKLESLFCQDIIIYQCGFCAENNGSVLALVELEAVLYVIVDVVRYILLIVRDTYDRGNFVNRRLAVLFGTG